MLYFWLDRQTLGLLPQHNLKAQLDLQCVWILLNLAHQR